MGSPLRQQTRFRVGTSLQERGFSRNSDSNHKEAQKTRIFMACQEQDVLITHERAEKRLAATP